MRTDAPMVSLWAGWLCEPAGSAQVRFPDGCTGQVGDKRLIPQIALAIGVLTSNRRGGWCTSSKIGRGAVAGCHCWAAIAGDRGGWVYTLADWTWCRCWLPLLTAIAGCHCWGWGGWVYTLADWTWWRCWPLMGAIAGLPLLGAIAGERGGGGCTSWRIGCGDVAGCRCWVPLLGAIAGDGGVGVQVGGLDVVTLLGERSPTSPNTPRARAGPRARGLREPRGLCGPAGTPHRNIPNFKALDSNRPLR